MIRGFFEGRTPRLRSGAEGSSMGDYFQVLNEYEESGRKAPQGDDAA